MSRYLVQIRSAKDRETVHRMIDAAPVGTRVELKAARRSLPQNELMWSLLAEVALQKSHYDRRYTPDQWKCLFMHACGKEVQFIPSLDGMGFIPWGNRSSDLSKAEMTDLIEFIFAWGAENGVEFSHNEVAA